MFWVKFQAFDLNEMNEILEEKGILSALNLVSETSLANPVFLLETVGQTETDNPLEDGVDICVVPKKNVSIRRVLIKRLLILAGVVAIFIVLFALRNVNPITTDSLSALGMSTKPAFNSTDSNETTVIVDKFMIGHNKHGFLLRRSLLRN